MSSPTYTKQEQEPASEEVTEVADGVLRMQLPISLPGLGHVNCYALVDGDGVALVDPGLPGPESWSALVARLKHAEIPVERVHTVVVTHSHPDHFGGSAQLREVGGRPGVECVQRGAVQQVEARAVLDHLHEVGLVDLLHLRIGVGAAGRAAGRAKRAGRGPRRPESSP